MATRPSGVDSSEPGTPHVIQRRGLLAAAWAAVAAIVLKFTTQPAEAAVANVIYSTTGPGSLPNTVDSTVLIEAGSGLFNSGPVLQTQCNAANPSTVLFQSVIGTIPSPGTAIAGFCSAGTGVWGQTYSGHAEGLDHGL